MKRNEITRASILAKINLMFRNLSSLFVLTDWSCLNPKVSRRGTTPVSSQQDIQTRVIAVTSLEVCQNEKYRRFPGYLRQLTSQSTLKNILAINFNFFFSNKVNLGGFFALCTEERYNIHCGLDQNVWDGLHLFGFTSSSRQLALTLPTPSEAAPLRRFFMIQGRQTGSALHDNHQPPCGTVLVSPLDWQEYSLIGG